MIHWRRKVRQARGRRNGTCYEAVGPSILQEKLEMKWGIILLMHGKAFVALRSSKTSLSSLQEMFSVLCLNEKFDLKMSSPRKSSGFGGVAVVYLYFVVLHYVPTPILCQSSSSNSEKDRGVYGKQLFWMSLESLQHFLWRGWLRHCSVCHYEFYPQI